MPADQREAIRELVARLMRGDDSWRALMAPAVTLVVGGADAPVTREAIPWTGRTFTGIDDVAGFFARLFADGNFELLELELGDLMSDGALAAAFGHFRYRARATGRTVDSDFAIKATFGQDGLIERYQFFEDTYAVASAFRSEGSWTLLRDGEQRVVPGG